MTHVKIKDLGIRFMLDRKGGNTLKEMLFFPFRKKRSFWAIRHIDLELKPGDVLGITGPNGSGKSTLLRAITKIYSTDEGSIEVEGSVSLLAIGAGFESELTGLENIYLSGSIFGFPKEKIDKIVPKVIEFSGIGEFMYQPLRTYSSGMQARLGFAVAINLDPDILLIDETLAVGDKEFREKCRIRIHNTIIDGKKIIIIVSHDQGLIDSLCNKSYQFGKKPDIKWG